MSATEQILWKLRETKITTRETVDLIVAQGGEIDGSHVHGHMVAAIAKFYAKQEKRQMDIWFIEHPIDLARLLEKTNGRRVLFIGITPGSAEATIQVAARAASLYIMDHHKTAFLAHDSQRTCRVWDFNLSESGVALAWNFFFPRQPIPTWVSLIGRHEQGMADYGTRCMTSPLYHGSQPDDIVDYYMDLIERGEFYETEDFAGQVTLEKISKQAEYVKAKNDIHLEAMHAGIYWTLYNICPTRLMDAALKHLREVYTTIDIFVFVEPTVTNPIVVVERKETKETKESSLPPPLTILRLRRGLRSSLDLTEIAAWMMKTERAVCVDGHPHDVRIWCKTPHLTDMKNGGDPIAKTIPTASLPITAVATAVIPIPVDVTVPITTIPKESHQRALTCRYTNYRGETSMRRFTPTGKMVFGSNEFHTTPQWLMEVWDLDKEALRTYALLDMQDVSPLISFPPC